VTSNESTTRGSQLTRAGRLALALAAVAALGLLASGCGGSSSGQGVAQVDSSPNKSNAVAYSACMRKNGVPKSPDPDASGGVSLQGPGLDSSTPQFKAAQSACQNLLPKGGNDSPTPGGQAKLHVKDAVKFAACMRKNGVPDFPDPGIDASGLTWGKPATTKTHSPPFKAAEEACKKLLPPGAAP
jgi:hypothetical protein